MPIKRHANVCTCVHVVWQHNASTAEHWELPAATRGTRCQVPSCSHPRVHEAPAVQRDRATRQQQHPPASTNRSNRIAQVMCQNSRHPVNLRVCDSGNQSPCDVQFSRYRVSLVAFADGLWRRLSARVFAIATCPTMSSCHWTCGPRLFLSMAQTVFELSRVLIVRALSTLLASARPEKENERRTSTRRV